MPTKEIETLGEVTVSGNLTETWNGNCQKPCAERARRAAKERKERAANVGEEGKGGKRGLLKVEI